MAERRLAGKPFGFGLVDHRVDVILHGVSGIALGSELIVWQKGRLVQERARGFARLRPTLLALAALAEVRPGD